MFRMFLNPCLGSFRCLCQQLLAAYQSHHPADLPALGHIRVTLSTNTLSAASAAMGQLGLEKSGTCPAGIARAHPCTPEASEGWVIIVTDRSGHQH